MAFSTRRFSGVSGANEALTVSATGSRFRLLWVTAKYSAAPTQTGVVVTLNSALGAAYDTALSTGAANTQANTYIPSGNIIIEQGDAIDVLAPAAGGVITSAVVVCCEFIE